MLAHGIRTEKNPQTMEDLFWIFTDFHGVMRVQSPTFTPPHKNFINGVASPEIVYCYCEKLKFAFFSILNIYKLNVKNTVARYISN